MLPKGLLKEHSQAIAVIIRCMDVLAIVVAGFFAFIYRFGHWQMPSQYLVALLVAALLSSGVFSFFHLYDSIRGKNFFSHLKDVVQALCAVLLLLAGLAFLTKSGEEYSRAWFLYWAIGAFLFLLLFRCLLLLMLRLMRARGWNERRVVIIGAGELGQKLADTVQHALWTGFRIITFYDAMPESKPKDIYNIPVQKITENLGAEIAAKQIDEVWLALPLSAADEVKKILHALRHHTLTTRYVLDFFALDLLNHSIEELAGFPVLNIKSSPMVGMNRFIKAVEDRVLATLILIVISPVLLVVALLVKLSSAGPIFYRQKRVGWNGKEFEILKFRSMPVDAESTSGPVWAQAGEKRATRIGAFLRKTSLDELPQFINVLRGEMSIVGPRPERAVFVEKFKDEIPGYMQKHLVKAGITGWAQVNGWRGNTSLEKRIEYDLYYIEHWSLMFDLKIIFLTLIQGIFHKNAY